jgi:hypothetical protein
MSSSVFYMLELTRVAGAPGVTHLRFRVKS